MRGRTGTKKLRQKGESTERSDMILRNVHQNTPKTTIECNHPYPDFIQKLLKDFRHTLRYTFIRESSRCFCKHTNAHF